VGRVTEHHLAEPQQLAVDHLTRADDERQQQQRQGGQGGQGGRQGRGGFGQPNPDAEVLQTALDSGASADDIKVKLTAYRAAAKVKEGQLEKAQDELRQLLSVKQEARAVLLGLLK
jgi:hypothetical protein